MTCSSVHVLMNSAGKRRPPLKSANPFHTSSTCWQDRSAMSQSLNAGSSTLLLGASLLGSNAFGRGALSRQGYDDYARAGLE